MTDFAATRAMFDLPEGVIYLDGNSLGPLPRAAPARVAATMAQWGGRLIRGWNECGWMEQSTRIGDRIARLVGAPQGSVIMGDTLSVKLFQALAAALDLGRGRKVILTDSGNFPSDLYIAEGLIAALDQGHELKIVAPEQVAGAIDGRVAVLMLTQVDYRTGRLHDMADLTRRAHAAGALALWDLAHSAGALPVDLAAAEADFAVGCTYKYLNGGPGAPAFIHVAPRHIERVRPLLSGWLGHAAPFAFDTGYRPGPGIERMRVGTPPVLALAVLDAALDAFEGIDMGEVRRASLALSDLFIALVETRCPELALASPRADGERGSQVSFAHPHGYAVMQALIARGVIGDFRAPDLIRFGFAPLYNSEADVRAAADILAGVLASRDWDRPQFRRKALVT